MLLQSKSSQTEIEELLKFIKGNPDSRELQRALAVKLVFENYSYSQIQQVLNVSLGFISKWTTVFKSQGIGGLKLGYKGDPGYLTLEQKSKVITWLKNKDYWDLAEVEFYLSESYGISFKSKQSYYDLFTLAGISWKKSPKKNPKKEPELVKLKKKEITDFLKESSPDIAAGTLTVFILDECHLLWGDTCGYIWGKTNIRIEVPITNQRERQTYFGALDYGKKEFLVQGYPTANSECTVEFLKYLRSQRPNQRIAVIWDGASYHKYGEFKKYLESVNEGLKKSEWLITCILFAPNAPEQNPVEDIWLQAKNFVRKYYHFCKNFAVVKKLFTFFTHHQIFDFPKLNEYAYSSQIE